MGLIRKLSSDVAGVIYRPTDDIAAEYHKWYWGSLVFMDTSWLGVGCMKSVSDMWNYQEILTELRPSLLIEFGTCQGGSALFFASILRQIGAPFQVLSVDISHRVLSPAAHHDPDIVFLKSSSTAPAVAEHIGRLEDDFPR